MADKALVRTGTNMDDVEWKEIESSGGGPSSDSRGLYIIPVYEMYGDTLQEMLNNYYGDETAADFFTFDKDNPYTNSKYNQSDVRYIHGKEFMKAVEQGADIRIALVKQSSSGNDADATYIQPLIIGYNIAGGSYPEQHFRAQFAIAAVIGDPTTPYYQTAMNFTVYSVNASEKDKDGNYPLASLTTKFPTAINTFYINTPTPYYINNLETE